ncbi:hypothetical protein C3747_96g14 [Trypanosoma cruzi]|uniref:Uncharacterized protein n=2 Tax=Trypanosoma cruzi TaxID=5693 RepID=Q4D716_TRYCC|nr:hypothetical protein, conserved [Trypanosoma cruzi]EAN88314.1 hypothetical protein, conserved [Trypanosoma cruzi]PWV07878.1 hypothetical protein C3747_96g14 [Trypanosoma cruzi]|eukprot:XP_810165.1 hypothetical protein [Trypanosoma cruzi strain CL Brener]
MKMQQATKGEDAFLVDSHEAASLTFSCEAACACGVDGAPSEQHAKEVNLGNAKVSTVVEQADGTRQLPVDDALLCDTGNTKVILTGSQKEEEEEAVGEEESEKDEEGFEEEEEYEEESDDEEEYEEDEENKERSEEMAEGEAEENEYIFEPPGDGGNDPKIKKDVFVIHGKKYAASAFIKNAGFMKVQKKLRRNPKTPLIICSRTKVHNVMECQFLHLTNRAVLVGDRYVRINMLLDNPARVALLKNPLLAAKATFCTVANGGHDASMCSALHLLPGIVFVGGPQLGVAYFATELHDNLALRRLRDDANSCGRWCRNQLSHVVLTCAFVHYNRGKVYTEVPREPSRPLAVIPSLRPRAPRPTGGREGRGGPSRGRGSGGRGRGRGGRGRGSGGIGRRMNRGRGGHSGVESAPRPHVATAAPAISDMMDSGNSTLPVDSVAPMLEERAQAQKERLLNLLLVVLVVFVAMLAYLLNFN